MVNKKIKQKKIRFDFLFSDCDLQNIHLTKDLVMVPFYLQKEFNYESRIICSKKKNDDYGNMKNVPGLKVLFVKKPRLFYLTKYLIKNAKDIDVLMQFHTNPRQIFFCFIYKLINKNGVCYVKGDISRNILDMNKLGLNHLFRKTKTKMILMTADILSVEDNKIYKFIRKQYPSFQRKIVSVPNGFESKDSNIPPVLFEEKDNLIITIGRLGTYQKATENLLESLEIIKKYLKGWKILLIGTIEKNFENKIEVFYRKNP